ncbi:MAG TPA: hypothetical protein VHF06_04490 [Pseudonocardiaceae bacterium]|nr:hypothetical protein [Pseudonocardiaceae bacterium]
MAACRAAYDRWVARADNDLTVYMDLALRALAKGFDIDTSDVDPDLLADPSKR